MFDYQYGCSTKSVRYRIKEMLPSLHVTQNTSTRVISLTMQFLPCFEVIDLSYICKKWYHATWDTTLWREVSRSMTTEEVFTSIFALIDSKVKAFEASVQKQIEDTETFRKLSDCIRYKLVCITYIYRHCLKCSSSEGKLRFMPILKRTLCFSCSKDPDFSMISLENAESEYHVSQCEIESQQLDGLRVPHTNNSGKFMFVYYLTDILKIVKSKDPNFAKAAQHRTCIEERRRTEIVWYMRELQIPFDFIETYLNTEGTLAHNYMMGRSRMTADKVAKALAKIHFCEKRKEDSRSKADPQRSDSPKIVKKVKLSEDDMVVRKMQLIDRLTLMGLDTEKIDFDDKSSLAYSYIVGRTSKELGVIAGKVWREFKPIFTGVAGKTTQRIKDL